MKTTVERASAYLAKMPVSISGQGGHAAAFAAALCLAKGFDLGEQDALPLLVEWNGACMPPWSESDLRHKIRDAAKSAKPNGYLLNEHDAPVRIRTAPVFENEAEKRKRQRQSWPQFREPTKLEIETIALLRYATGSGVRALVDVGMLHIATFESHECFVIHEDHFAQARRLDGGLLPTAGGEKKTKNLTGSEGAFIGGRLLGESPNVLLVEGCVGMIESFAAIALADVQGWTAMAATSAVSRFRRDPAMMADLAGRRIRIIPDDNEAGLAGAGSWLADLRAEGLNAEVRLLPLDLGEIVADSFDHEQILTSLFL